MSSINDLAATFEATAEAHIEARGRAPLTAKGQGRLRAVKVVGADGEIVKVATHADVLAGLLVREGVEGAVVDGKRPSRLICSACGTLTEVSWTGRLPKFCARCRKKRPCADCGAWVARGAQRCHSCASRLAQARLTPEQRSEQARQRNARRSPESKSAQGREARAKVTPERRSEAVRKGHASRTAEQRSATGRMAQAARMASSTPEERSEMARRSAATRAAKAT